MTASTAAQYVSLHTWQQVLLPNTCLFALPVFVMIYLQPCASSLTVEVMFVVTLSMPCHSSIFVLLVITERQQVNKHWSSLISCTVTISYFLCFIKLLFHSFLPQVRIESSDFGMNNMVVWNMAMSILVKYYQHFGEISCLIFYIFPRVSFFSSFMNSFIHSFHLRLFLSLRTVIFPFFPPSFVFVSLFLPDFIVSVFYIILSHSAFRFLEITRVW